MRHRRMGSTGLRVPELTLGTLTFGQEVDRDEARRLVTAYLDAGGFAFDSANSYAAGRSEEILGELLEGRRDDIVLTTKARFPTGSGPNDRGASRRHLLDAVHRSLRRLRTDWLDVLFLHCWDWHTPLAETLSTLDHLVRSGKVRYVGASNFAGWQAARAIGLAERAGWEPLTVLQPQYSLASRSSEREILPLCEHLGLGVFAWSPLGGGLLTGKYGAEPEHAPDGTRAADSARRGSTTMRDRFTPQNLATVEALRQVSADYGWQPAQIAIAWVLRRPLVSTTLLGARTVAQLQANLAAREVDLPKEAWQRLDAASAPPPEYPYDFLEYARTV